MLLARSVVFTMLLAWAPALAKTLAVNDNCPTRSRGHVWSLYFLHKYAGGGPLKADAGLRFDTAKQLPDKILLGNVDLNGCYIMYFHLPGDPNGPAGWESFHNPHGEPSNNFEILQKQQQHMMGMSGDPSLRQINVTGTIFTFDDKDGRVFDKKKDVVGHLTCYVETDREC